HALDLALDAFHGVRQQSFQAVLATLRRRESGAFVADGIVQKLIAVEWGDGTRFAGLLHGKFSDEISMRRSARQWVRHVVRPRPGEADVKELHAKNGHRALEIC